MKYQSVAYFCDGHGCPRQCADTMTPEEWEKHDCHHTREEAHAKNKCRRSRKFKVIKGDYFEVG